MKRIVIATGIALSSLSVSAADLLSLYQQAQDSDPQILAARATRDAGYEVRPQAKAGLLPNISLSGDLSYQKQDILTSPSIDQNFSSSALALRVVQPLFRKDRSIAVDQADDQVAQADSEYNAAKQALMLRIAQAYFGVLAAQDSQTFAQTEKKAIARQLDQAQQRFDVGLVAITDVHEAQARFDLARANEITAENSLGNAWESLREIISTSPSSLSDMRLDVPLVAPQPASLDEWSTIAQKNNPTIRSASLAADIARKQIDVRYAGHYPSLDVVAALSRSRSGSTVVSDVNSGSIGLQLAVPLYSGGSVNSATRQARHLLTASQQGLDQQRRSVDRQVRNAYRGVQSNISRISALKAAQVSAQSALEATEAGFDVGTRTLVDVLNSQRDLFRAKRDFAQSRYDYVLNTLSLLQAAGTLTVEDMQRVNGWLN